MKRFYCVSPSARRSSHVYASSNSFNSPSSQDLRLACKNIFDHINSRLAEYGYPEVRFKIRNVRKKYCNSDEAQYSADLVDSHGVVISCILEFIYSDDGEWIPREEVYDVTDELDEVFYEYCSASGVDLDEFDN